MQQVTINEACHCVMGGKQGEWIREGGLGGIQGEWIREGGLSYHEHPSYPCIK